MICFNVKCVYLTEDSKAKATSQILCISQVKATVTQYVLTTYSL